MTFAIITPALIVGAYVERIGFAFVMTFLRPLDADLLRACGTLDLGAVVLLAGAEWSLFADGVNDFAGGIVVHQTAGMAALIVAFFLGPRRDKHKPPHNPGMVMIGAAMLWVGWFGF